MNESARTNEASARAIRVVRIALLALGLAALALGLAWSLPRARAASDAPPLDLVLVDASASASELRPTWRAEVARLLAAVRAESAARGAELAVVAYDAGATLAAPPKAASAFDASAALAGLPRAGAATRGSELGLALDLAESVRAEHGAARGRLIVLGDASYTGGDPAARLARFAAHGFAVERRGLGAPPPRAVALGELRLPRALHAGAALAVRVLVVAPPESEVRLAARAAWRRADGTRATVERALAARAPAGAPRDADGFATWSVAFDFGVVGPGAVDVGIAACAARVGEPGEAPRAPDAPSSARAEAFARVVVGDAPCALVAGARGPALDALAAAFERAGFAVDALDADAVPAERLERADVLVTLDRAPRALPTAELGAFVRGGGGWLALLGSDARAAFAGERGAFELLPLVPPRGAPARELVFLVDGSGSMAGDAQVALSSALVDLLALTGPGERIEFRWFARDLEAPLTRNSGADAAERARFAAELLAAHPPGGPTRMLAALERWFDERRAKGDALLFVLGDGRESETEHAAERARKLAERARAESVRIAPIAVGADADLGLLAALATDGADVPRAGALEAAARERLARILARELGVARAAGAGPHAVRPAPDVRGEPATSVLAAQRALFASAWPAVATHVAADATERASVLWRSETGAPLLALEAVGLGRTAALAFAPGDDAEAWTEPAPLALLAPLARCLGEGRARAALVARLDGERLVLEGAALAGAPARIGARVRPQDGSVPSEDVVLEPDLGPGGDLAARAAPWPKALDRAAGGFEVEVALDPPRGLVLAPRRAPEDRLPRALFVPPAGGPEPDSPLAAAADPRAGWVLAAAVVLLAGAALLGLGGPPAVGRRT